MEKKECIKPKLSRTLILYTMLLSERSKCTLFMIICVYICSQSSRFMCPFFPVYPGNSIENDTNSIYIRSIFNLYASLHNQIAKKTSEMLKVCRDTDTDTKAQL